VLLLWLYGSNGEYFVDIGAAWSGRPYPYMDASTRHCGAYKRRLLVFLVDASSSLYFFSSFITAGDGYIELVPFDSPASVSEAFLTRMATVLDAPNALEWGSQEKTICVASWLFEPWAPPLRALLFSEFEVLIYYFWQVVLVVQMRAVISSLQRFRIPPRR